MATKRRSASDATNNLRMSAMNVIQNWRKLLNDERMVRVDSPVVSCIMGTNDYAALCGAVGILFGHMTGEHVVGDTGHFMFEGITIRESKSQPTGTMFA